jgi:hypothetical protein
MNRSKTQKAKAIRQLLRSKNYMLITDTAAAMRIDVTDNMNDTILIAQQRASLDRFKRDIVRLSRSFDKKLDDFYNPKKNKSVRKNSKRIPVKQG